MANAPIQPTDPGIDPGTPAQGDMPGAFDPPRSRSIEIPKSRVKSVAIAIGVGILALVVWAIATRDENPNPQLNPEGDVPVDGRR
jgi:hypothetical protein